MTAADNRAIPIVDGPVPAWTSPSVVIGTGAHRAGTVTVFVRPGGRSRYADQQFAEDLDRDGRLARDRHQRWQMPGTGDAHLVQGGSEHRVQHGGHRLRLEMPHLVVTVVQDLGRVGGLQGVGAQRAAHPSHDHRCFQPGASHVSNHRAHLTRREDEHVVPVAADVAAAGDVTAPPSPAPRPRGGRKQQAVLQRRGGGPVQLDVQGLNRQCGTIRRQLQQVTVIGW